MSIAAYKGDDELRLAKSHKFGLVGAGLLALFASFVLLDSLSTRFQAARFLSDVRLLRPGSASLQDLLNLRMRYGRFATVDESGCDTKHCTIYFRFWNKWLYRVRVAPPTLFGGGVTALNGTLSRIDLALQSGAAYEAQVVYSAEEPTAAPYTITRRESTPGLVVYLKVDLSPAAPEKLRQEAFHFNLGCLTQWRGCNDAHAMLPAVQTRAAENARD